MGWWKIAGTDDVIGDGPLDNLTTASADVVAEYRSTLGRPPTRAEWEALLTAVLGAEPPEEPMIQDGVARAVTVELK